MAWLIGSFLSNYRQCCYIDPTLTNPQHRIPKNFVTTIDSGLRSTFAVVKFTNCRRRQPSLTNIGGTFNAARLIQVTSSTSGDVGSHQITIQRWGETI